jgi:hypothetical protein
MARDPEEFEGLPVAQVAAVLRLHGVDVATIGTTTYLSRGETHKAVDFESRIRRRMIQTLARWFEVPVHHFFHPEMIPRQE